MNADSEVTGAVVHVQAGTSAAGKKFYVSSFGGTLNTDAMVWTEGPGGASVTAGDGISKSGDEISVKFGSGVEADGSGNVQIKAADDSVNVGAGGLQGAVRTLEYGTLASASSVSHKMKSACVCQGVNEGRRRLSSLGSRCQSL